MVGDLDFWHCRLLNTSRLYWHVSLVYCYFFLDTSFVIIKMNTPDIKKKKNRNRHIVTVSL